MLALFGLMAHADNDKPIDVASLPTAARQFIDKYFAGEKIAMAKQETGLMSRTYEVVFASGKHIGFDSKGAWDEVDCGKAAVPDGIVPKPIVEYVTATYQQERIVKIDKDRKEYEVRLSNGLELTFDKRYKLIDIDD